MDPLTVPAGLSATAVRVANDPAIDSDDPAGTLVNLPNVGHDRDLSGWFERQGLQPDWKNGEPLAVQLDRYNNGMLCAPHD